MENLCDTSKSIHDKIIKKMIRPLKNQQIKKVIDAGSGVTSASILLKYFNTATLDAIVYPGDNRKKNPLQNDIGSDRLNVVETNICTSCMRKKYDFCLAHLVLGEANKFSNSFENLFHQIMDIRARYFVLVDVWEDPCVHFRYIEQYLKEKGFNILKKHKFKNPKPEHYPKVKFDKYKLEYDSKHFMAYLIEKIEK